MRINGRLRAKRVTNEKDRRRALDVLASTYRDEKGWVIDPESQFPASDLSSDVITWFVATFDRQPVGVLRVLYAPPLATYAQYDFKILDTSVRVDDFIRHHRIAEIGRFAVVASHRASVRVATALMRVATAEIVARGYTHLITDVFEDDAHSPYGFHTRVMGFSPIATHDVGELRSRSRRITLVLDLKAAYQRLKASGNWVFRQLTRDWTRSLHQRMAT